VVAGALALLVLALVLASGCGNGSGKVTTIPGANQSVPVSEVKPRTTEERVVVDYYRAINDKHYQAAYDLTSANFKSKYGSLADFTAYYRDFITGVQVVYLKKLEQFSTPQKVEFDTNYRADYVKYNPPATGYLPPINIAVPDPAHAGKWLLDEIATGP
jgi:hypothetical protein